MIWPIMFHTYFITWLANIFFDCINLHEQTNYVLHKILTRMIIKFKYVNAMENFTNKTV